MTQKEAKQKKVCVKCKWCKQVTYEHPNWTEYEFFCKNNIVHIDPVTGDETYMRCINQNREGECELYEEEKVSWLERFFKIKKDGQ